MGVISNRSEFRLSRAQSAVWLDLLLNPNDVSYSIWTFAELKGAIDTDMLTTAIHHVIRGSTAARLRFHGDARFPMQYVDAGLEVRIPRFDFGDSPDPFDAALAWMTEDHNKPFEPNGDAPMFRNALLMLSPTRLIWYRNFHHLVNDGYGLGLLSAQVADAYLALVRGEQMPTQYGDYRSYLDWEAQYENSNQFDADKKFWFELYEDLPQPVSLSSRSLRAGRHRDFRMRRIWLPRSLLDALYDLEKNTETNFGHICVALVALYVHKVTGAKDLSICVPVHGREKDTMNMMGMCVNTVPLRLSIDGTKSVKELIRQVSTRFRDAMEHRRYRFEDLRRDLGLVGNEVSPFRITANVLRTVDACVFGEHPMHVDTLSAGPVDDITFMIFENRADPNRFRLSILFNAALYDEWEIECHARYFERFMSEAALKPDETLRNMQIVSSDERRTMLLDWNKTAKPNSDLGCFHSLLESRASRNPEATAVEFGADSVTYAELNRRANRMANHLHRSGVSPRDIVGLCIDRSPEMIVCLLGVLKAGAAYLPLDPDTPLERLDHMAREAGVKLILTQTEHEFALPDHPAELMFVDAIAAAIAEQPANLPSRNVTSADLAYVIYTSGSTGKPKAVQIEHAGLCNLALAQADLFHVASTDRVLQFARLTFDASISEIAMTFAAGATLVLANKEDLMPGNLNALLRKNAISIATLPPSILPSLRREQFPLLKTLIVAGESCPTELAAEWRACCRVINAYGPTEATVCATCGEYEGGPIVPIGRPIHNVHVYILDEALDPVPVGIAGELCIGGIGVARGYLGQPELTAAKFILLEGVGGKERIYKTGDMARYLPDGSIEFLGRADQQHKIRGYRVELGEIESALLQHPAVAACATIVRENGRRKEIIAYVVARVAARDDAMEADGRIVKKWLRTKLPEYMVPSHIVFIESIPTTTSGKLNRGALPPPSCHGESDAALVAPRTEAERLLARVWGSVLKTESIGVHDNFFDLGGDSVACIEIMSLVWDKAGVELTARDILECETLEALAQRIDIRPGNRIAETIGHSPVGSFE